MLKLIDAHKIGWNSQQSQAAIAKQELMATGINWRCSRAWRQWNYAAHVFDGHHYRREWSLGLNELGMGQGEISKLIDNIDFANSCIIALNQSMNGCDHQLVAGCLSSISSQLYVHIYYMLNSIHTSNWGITITNYVPSTYAQFDFIIGYRMKCAYRRNGKFHTEFHDIHFYQTGNNHW